VGNRSILPAFFPACFVRNKHTYFDFCFQREVADSATWIAIQLKIQEIGFFAKDGGWFAVVSDCIESR
jgi:hypothetical protein